ncbi:hypothetical protein GALMADRAFT_866548 [Galerina marginata CBS 339.88]|uniref:Uncharacterized protein n=1 Tax=Galerina marginata (strain CBS 339.88) TaxID=685588 RepID=A0A067TVN7_GALM3|nr:hypothetical protein GALMADRAFT_866548 [Galerina marginata CBS 339.88]
MTGVQRNQEKRGGNGEICVLTVPNSEHKGSGDLPERRHQWLMARRVPRNMCQHCTYLCYLISAYLTGT